MSNDRNSPSQEETLKARLRTLDVGPAEEPLEDAFEALASEEARAGTPRQEDGVAESGEDTARPEPQDVSDAGTKQAN